jgi:hypothetical protein
MTKTKSAQKRIRVPMLTNVVKRFKDSEHKLRALIKDKKFLEEAQKYLGALVKQAEKRSPKNAEKMKQVLERGRKELETLRGHLETYKIAANKRVQKIRKLAGLTDSKRGKSSRK